MMECTFQETGTVYRKIYESIAVLAAIHFYNYSKKVNGWTALMNASFKGQVRISKDV